MLIRGDARALPLRDQSVHCVVTSPPYWGLRDYGSPTQIGLEPTPAAYVAAIVAVFAELGRVLRADGTCWVNMGDAYVHGIPGGGCVFQNGRTDGRTSHVTDRARGREKISTLAPGLKVKDLIGLPWRVAFALQAEGWYLRSDIIWAKPNPMPESVTDRPTKAHEYLFLLTKSERYFYDAAAIAEQLSGALRSSNWATRKAAGAIGGCLNRGARQQQGDNVSHDLGGWDGTRNKRSVWTIPTLPYAGAHFATMPEALVEPCILAGCPLGGIVLDPFVGSGTVVAVAERLGRQGVGLDLAYQGLATVRTRQRGFRFDAIGAV